jgi:deoxycytidylate deaminase
MVERAAELARDSHARTRHAAVLVRDGSLLAWGTNGVPFPGEDHCFCKFGEYGHHDLCRTHAEQRAITLARADDGWQTLQQAKLIYVRLEADDSVRLQEPHFCARCSRLALSLGIGEWIFALSEGLVGYSSSDYDKIAQLRWSQLSAVLLQAQLGDALGATAGPAGTQQRLAALAGGVQPGLPRGVRQQLGDAVLAGHRHHGTDPAAGHGQPLPRPVCRGVVWPVTHTFIFPPAARCPAPG